MPQAGNQTAAAPTAQEPAAKPLEILPSPTVVKEQEAPHTAVIQTPAPKPAAPAQETPKPAAKPLEVAAVSPSVTIPQPGTSFIQVRAMSRDEAEVLATVLARKGMHTWLRPARTTRFSGCWWVQRKTRPSWDA
jgi:hypothetical protein